MNKNERFKHTSWMILRINGTSACLGSDWLTRLQSRVETAAMRDFTAWLLATIAAEASTPAA
ncbi:type 2 periplasmic-binding domain-containing protein [Erwinia tasmaniensis]|uniref:hypothetical protein n=1 Tax=Erwinia tasmaniensis TaxID=338565 RepID=UPI00031AAF1D